MPATWSMIFRDIRNTRVVFGRSGSGLDESGLTARLRQAEATPVDGELLRAVHTPAYLDSA